MLLVLGSIFQMSTPRASALERVEVRNFIDTMSKKYGFSATELNSLFQNVVFSETVLEAITRPAETMPWYKYRPLFLESGRIRMGVEFWRKNRKILGQAEAEFGVPAEIMVAIIGVETRYGRIKGRYPVINALTTLAFDYPQRSSFFLSELEQYLLLAREQGLNPLEPKGSYAGAMGIPQFISSSYRKYAVDYDGDGVIDIWENPDDAIGSVGNYFKQHGWRSGEPVAVPATVKGDKYKELLSDDLMPVHTPQDLAVRDISAPAPDTLVKLLVLDQRNGNEYWVVFENFYVISRYNKSALYSMAVYQLAGEIKAGFQQDAR
jgi:membrane-bound lytic murein transglycosylase B